MGGSRGRARSADGLSDEPRRLRVSAVRALEDAQLCVAGFEEWDEMGRLDQLLALGARAGARVASATSGLHAGRRGRGRDRAATRVVSLWDLAAPKVIVEEAGGRFTDLAGVERADGGSALATNGLVHDAALALVGT